MIAYNLRAMYAVSCHMAIAMLLVGCSTPQGDVPAPLRIDTGMDPDKQDQYTRFRTTYYFRVVDSCRAEDGTQNGDYDKRFGTFLVRKLGKTKILNDTVYRFRMTGKASALFNTVNFGSGVLRAEQIDPFGSKVEYDEGTFKVKSGYNLRQKEMREALLEEIGELRRLYKELKAESKELNDESKDLTAELQHVITSKIQLLNGGGAIASEKGPAGATALCPDGRPIKHSYLLYGPEGVRELDPDERLLMAMSSDSKPLISLLQELSGRQRKALTTPAMGAEVLMTEQAWILDSKDRLNEASRQLDNDPDKQPTPQDMVNQLISTKKETIRLPALAIGGAK